MNRFKFIPTNHLFSHLFIIFAAIAIAGCTASSYYSSPNTYEESDLTDSKVIQLQLSNVDLVIETANNASLLQISSGELISNPVNIHSDTAVVSLHPSSGRQRLRADLRVAPHQRIHVSSDSSFIEMNHLTQFTELVSTRDTIRISDAPRTLQIQVHKSMMDISLSDVTPAYDHRIKARSSMIDIFRNGFTGDIQRWNNDSDTLQPNAQIVIEHDSASSVYIHKTGTLYWNDSD